MEENYRWGQLKDLDDSRYKKTGGTIGIRPTVKNMEKLSSQTREENSIHLEKIKESEKRALEVINESKKEFDKKEQERLRVLNEESERDSSFIKVSNEENLEKKNNMVEKKNISNIAVLDEEDEGIKQNFMYTIFGLGRLYMNKTNSILNPLRFVMENKKKVLSALILFIVPALMTYYLVNNVSVFANQIAQETLVKKGIYTLVFYFSSMFFLLTTLVLLDGIVKVFKTLLNTAKAAGKEN